MRFFVAVAFLVLCVSACRAADGDDAPSLDVGEVLKPLSDGLEKAVAIVGEISEDPPVDNPSKLVKKIISAVDAVVKGLLKTIDNIAPDLKVEETVTPVYESFKKVLKDILKPITDALGPGSK